MTLTRLLVSSYYEPNNMTKQNGIVAFITGLEPIVGIINACMPFFPPVFRRIGHSPPYRGLSQFFKSQPTQNIDDSDPVGNTWGHNAQIHSSPRKDMTGFVSLDDDPIELTRIKLRHDIYVETSTHESKDGLV
jgi:hypothetical protein